MNALQTTAKSIMQMQRHLNDNNNNIILLLLLYLNVLYYIYMYNALFRVNKEQQ